MIQEQIDKIMKELKADVNDALEKVSKEVAKEAQAQLKQKSPKRTGRYAKGWRQTRNKDMIILYNKDKGWLTHILEKDHALRNGGRSRPKKHIEPVDEWAQKEMVRRIEDELK